MPAFTPKQRNQIYAEISAQVLAFAPITSTQLGETSDNIIFGVSDQIYELYVQATNGLSLLNLNNITGTELDSYASDYPGLHPRYEANFATSRLTVTDPSITVHDTEIAAGGAQDGDTFLNVDDTTGFPPTGTLLIGVRGSVSYETWPYTSILGNQFISGTPLAFDHGANEPVFLTTVGDRTFTGPYTVSTISSLNSPAVPYITTGTLIIYDGEASGDVNIRCQTPGIQGNTPANTIRQFVGSPPFAGAVCTNGTPVNNGRDRESDADLRSRIRQQVQALSSANEDAVYAALLETEFEGATIVFAQIVEDPNPSIPSLCYIDDGSGFIPDQFTTTDEIVLVDVADGGERRFRIPPDYRPVVANDSQNAAFVFPNVELKLNNVVINQGTAADEYEVNPDSGYIRLNTVLAPGDRLVISEITWYGGLVQNANWRVYGNEDDRENYPGIIALGAWAQVRVPTLQAVSVEGIITPDGSRGLAEIVNEVTQNILNYINGLGIANSVVRNKLISLGFVRGVKSFDVTIPAANVIIPDGVRARTTFGNISVS